MYSSFNITEIDGLTAEIKGRPIPVNGREQAAFFGSLTAANGEFAGREIRVLTTKLAEFVSKNGVAVEIE